MVAGWQGLCFLALVIGAMRELGLLFRFCVSGVASGCLGQSWQDYFVTRGLTAARTRVLRGALLGSCTKLWRPLVSPQANQLLMCGLTGLDGIGRRLTKVGLM